MSEIQDQVKKIVVDHLGIDDLKLYLRQNLLMTWVQIV